MSGRVAGLRWRAYRWHVTGGRWDRSPVSGARHARIAPSRQLEPCTRALRSLPNGRAACRFYLSLLLGLRGSPWFTSLQVIRTQTADTGGAACKRANRLSATAPRPIVHATYSTAAPTRPNATVTGNINPP